MSSITKKYNWFLSRVSNNTYVLLPVVCMLLAFQEVLKYHVSFLGYNHQIHDNSHAQSFLNRHMGFLGLRYLLININRWSIRVKNKIITNEIVTFCNKYHLTISGFIEERTIWSHHHNARCGRRSYL